MKTITFLFLMITSILGFSQDGFPGNSLYFDSNEYVEIPNSSSLDLTNNYTLEAWIRPDDFGIRRGIISKYHTLGANGYFLRLSSTYPFSGLAFDGLETSNGILQPYHWYHIVAVNDNGTRRLYLNGELLTLSGTIETVASNTDAVCIGVDYLESPRWFNGEIDEVSIWNVALDETQIREHMHLVHTGSESGLVSYWQFNENSGTQLPDMVGANNGVLVDMENQDWVSSDIPVGGGTSDIQTETNGVVTFTGTGVIMDYASQGGASVTVTHIDNLPNQIPNMDSEVHTDDYWAIDRYGNGNYEADISFALNATLASGYQDHPSAVHLYHRATTSAGSWTQIASANSVNVSNNTVTFTNISNIGQFFISWNQLPSLRSIQDINCFELISDNFSNIDIGDDSYPSFTDIDGDGLLDLIVGERNGKLFHYEQVGENSTNFSLVSTNFNNIDVGYYSTPVFTDLDGDDLLDFIVGAENGKLFYYEQNSPDSPAFTLISNNFSSIDVGSWSTPTFVDLDGDGLLDLIIGEKDGNLFHYEQNSPNSTSFTLITNNFNSINDGLWPAPRFKDIDEDGLVDLIIGEEEGNLFHYEQDNLNSTSFSLITSSLCSVDVGMYATPTFADIIGSLGMVVGKTNGGLNYYEQKEVDSLFFTAFVGKSQTKEYFITAKKLTDNLLIQCDMNDFMVSLSENSGFVQSLEIAPVDGEIMNTIYVRYAPLTDISYNAKITQTSAYLDTSYIFLSGRVKRGDNYPGNALNFDGANDYVEIPNHSSLDLVNNYTLEAWIRPDSFNSMGGIISKYHTPSAFGYFLRLSSVFPYTDIDFDGLETTNGILQADQWYHIAAVNDNGTRKLYVNGEEQTLSGTIQTVASNTNPVRIGVDYMSSPRWFDGEIEEVRIWNIALDSIQIRENMHLNIPGSKSGLVSYWQFNENTGNSLEDIVEGNNGTLYNMNNSDWVQSTIPFGGGDSDSHSEANGSVIFANSSLSIDYNSQSGANITACRIDTVPNLNPADADHVFTEQYWVVHRYGNGSFDADLTFTLKEDLTSIDENNPSEIKLFTRESTADNAWTQLAEASAVDAANNTATFNGINGFSQFIIGRKISRLNVELIAYLEGAMNGGIMNTTLSGSGLLPLSQPFNTSPWNYNGIESVSAIPTADIVDWVLIELRDTTDVNLATPQTIIAQKAVFINNDGNVVDIDGTINPILFEHLQVQDNLYVVLWHRNHLGIISAVPMTEASGVYSYDFSTAISQAYLSGQKLIDGKAAMIGGDANQDGTVDNNDLLLWKTKAGERGYENADVNLDAEVNNKDKDDVGVPNEGSNSNVPD